MIATRRAFLLGSLAALAALLGCAKAREPQPGDAPRIVALSPAIALIVRDLGLESSVVGRHAYDLSLEKSIPVVGDQSGVDYEALALVRPTHILLDWGSRELPPRLLTLAQERGWTVRDYRMLSLADIRAATLAIADDLNDEAGRAQAAALAASMDDAWSPQPDLGRRAGRCLIFFGADSTGAAGPGSFHAQLIEALGARSAVAEGAPFVTLDAEDLRRLDPDSVLFFAPGADPARTPELLAPLARAQLRAVREGRVAVIAHPHGLTPSTAMIEVARAVARAVAQWPVIDRAP
ncbi:MAG: ABC transporter substrate-binding protein, partial [Phycisphaerales bacterium]|nr:ABC transporter substrate-binding protein [Phycisphaerales bacterium]